MLFLTNKMGKLLWYEKKKTPEHYFWSVNRSLLKLFSEGFALGVKFGNQLTRY